MGREDQKVIADRYQAFPRTLCFITHGDDVLLLRGASDKHIWPDQYNGVGGHLEPGEDVYTAALREVEEETGLTVQDMRFRGVINIPLDMHQPGVMLFVFTARATRRELCSSEEGKPEWIPRDQLGEIDLVEDLPRLLPRVLAMGPKDPPFFALYTYDEQDRLMMSFSSDAGSPQAASGSVADPAQH